MQTPITAQTGLPTLAQIQAAAERLAVSLGGGVHVNANDVALAIDAAHPGMSEEQFASIRLDCANAANTVRLAAISEMWGEPV